MFTGHYVTCTDNKGEIMTGRAGKKGKLNGQNLADYHFQLRERFQKRKEKYNNNKCSLTI